MKKDLKKEIVKYTSAAGALLAGTGAHAQYQYTDIADTTINTNNGIYALDLDQDGTTDFNLVQYVDTGSLGTTNAVLIQPVANSFNQVNGKKVFQYNYPFNLQAATVLDGNSQWNGAGGNFNQGFLAFVVDGQSYPNSNWVGPVTNGFLGLKIYKNLLPHYGWVRLDIGADSKSFTVKDFSVNLTVDSSIVVGSELLGTMENLLEQVRFTVHQNEITFTKPAHLAEVNIRIFDLAGREIIASTLENEFLQLSVSNGAAGMYIVDLEQNGLARREKILLY